MLGESLLVFVLALVYGKAPPESIYLMLMSISALDWMGRYLDKRSHRVARQPTSDPDTCILELFIHRYAKSVNVALVSDACSCCPMQ